LLGAILYEIITGHPPHTGKNAMKCLMAAARNEIRPTDKQGELVEIALKAMSTNPADRFRDVSSLQSSLREYGTHADSHALADRAREDLRRAAESGDRELLNRALFGFREALELWPGNGQAKTGMENVARALAPAERSQTLSDLDLAASARDANEPRHALLPTEIAAARQRDVGPSWLHAVRRWFRARP